MSLSPTVPTAATAKMIYQIFNCSQKVHLIIEKGDEL